VHRRAVDVVGPHSARMTKKQLRVAVASARAGRRRAKFSRELKGAVIEYCQPRRAEGSSWAELAGELGLHESQVQEWCAGRSRGARGKLKAVRLVDESSNARSGSMLSLQLPGGATIAGLSVADVAALLRALR